MAQKSQVNLIWFRRDLRLEDNTALNEALNSDLPVLPLFIFDDDILNDLNRDDPRVSFIHKRLIKLNTQLKKYSSSVYVKKGKPIEIYRELINEFDINTVFTNKDFEPYAMQRDKAIEQLLSQHQINFKSFKDHVIFEPGEILKKDGTPYTIYTPFKNTWLDKFQQSNNTPCKWKNQNNFFQFESRVLSLEDIGFKQSNIEVLDYKIENANEYNTKRDFPNQDATSKLGPHLRFGTVSIRSVISSLDLTRNDHQVFLSELIWREFFIQILFFFPKVVGNNFKAKYDGVNWLNNNQQFKSWCEGKTGYPIVDAGMRELNTTGYMHNRVRMITASFLCKHLLIDWKWGEAYFAEKLLDYELASNNGNWQWVAGTGCDSAPYFRVFNPTEQVKKFDASHEYIRKWVKDLETLTYPPPIIEHKFARERAIKTYKQGLTPE